MKICCEVCGAEERDSDVVIVFILPYLGWSEGPGRRERTKLQINTQVWLYIDKKDGIRFWYLKSIWET